MPASAELCPMLTWNLALKCNFVSVFFFPYAANCPSLRLSELSIRTPLCPNDSVMYTCILNSAVFYDSINTIWTGSKFNCPAANNTITLMQSADSPLNTSVIECGKVSAVMTNISQNCYTSVLTIWSPTYFNGSTVQCLEGSTNVLIGNAILVQEFKGKWICGVVHIILKQYYL